MMLYGTDSKKVFVVKVLKAKQLTSTISQSCHFVEKTIKI